MVYKRRKKSVVRFTALMTIDIFFCLMLLGIINNLQDIKEYFFVIAGILYFATQLCLKIYKLVLLIGRNHDIFKKGVKAIRDIFSE